MNISLTQHLSPLHQFVSTAVPVTTERSWTLFIWSHFNLFLIFSTRPSLDQFSLLSVVLFTPPRLETTKKRRKSSRILGNCFRVSSPTLNGENLIMQNAIFRVVVCVRHQRPSECFSRPPDLGDILFYFIYILCTHNTKHLSTIQ